jgi:hypothetical protein
MVVKFTHLITGKGIVVFDHTNVKAIIHGDASKEHTNAVWLILGSVPAPIPVKESEDAVLAILETANKGERA